MSQYISSMDTEGEYFETIEEIKEIGQQLKYGLEKQIFVYELGFNDRYIVKPVFKENSTDTLGTVLLRLMTDGK